MLLTVKVSDVVTLIDSCALRLETWAAGGMFLSSMVLYHIFVRIIAMEIKGTINKIFIMSIC